MWPGRTPRSTIAAPSDHRNACCVVSPARDDEPTTSPKSLMPTGMVRVPPSVLRSTIVPGLWALIFCELTSAISTMAITTARILITSPHQWDFWICRRRPELTCRGWLAVSAWCQDSACLCQLFVMKPAPLAGTATIGVGRSVDSGKRGDAPSGGQTTMHTKTDATRRSFIAVAGAALSAPVAAAAVTSSAWLPVSDGNGDPLAAQLTVLQDLNEIRGLNQAYLQHAAAGAREEM